MEKLQKFLKRKDIEISGKRYGIDALGAMAQGLFASLLIGTIISTFGERAGIELLITIGGYAKAVTGEAMAVAIGYSLHCPPLVLFSLVAVGHAANTLGGAGGPLAVLLITIIAAECGKAVSKETKIDIIVTPLVTIMVGAVLASLCAPAIGSAASAVGKAIMWATELQPFLMGVIISVIVGIALTLPISSAAICAALSLTGLAGGGSACGVLRADGWFCGHELSGKRDWRIVCTRDRHIDAADGKYREEAADLAAADHCVRDHGTDCDMCIPAEDERGSSGVRNGNLWSCRADRRVYRMAQ